ncbi:MAG: hypothetical protein CME70_19530 [Halobacteriovorax sp.]|nr:hypothetical protein [Halobacteriovorax sp.]MBK26199.1 hypothetical protein [Halobacteriovorax sp.]|tara:strand:- start:228 stop:686 length:459 start_codon:yes stop_codon:yes gene_type:complete
MNLLRVYIKELLSEMYLTPDKSIEYTALVLDGTSHQELSKLSPEKWKLHSHHMTIISPASGQQSKHRLPSRWIGSEECVTIVGIAKNDQVITGLVELGDLPLYTLGISYPHITIATNPQTAGRPEMSNDFGLGDFEPIPPIVICGRIEEVPR